MNRIEPLFSHLPPPAECLAVLVGCAELTIFGLGGFADPVAFLKGFGLPSRTRPGDNHLKASETDDEENTAVSAQRRALIGAVAARNIQNGICLLAFGLYWRDRRALGTVVFSGLITTLADTLMVDWYGSKDAVFGHVIGVFNSLAIGGALLYWGRYDKLY